MPKKLTIEFVREQFEKEGYTLLSDTYTDCEQRLKYICPEKHVGQVCWDSWQQGNRCAECAGLKKLTIDFIKKEFEKEGYTLLTKNYKNNKQRLKFVCPKRHKYFIKYNSWQQGHRCRICAVEGGRGENSARWNPNLTERERQKKRSLLPVNGEWAYIVKERDSFTCQICGDNRGGNLVSHHLESYKNNPSLRTVLDNGITLCRKCHKKFHSIYGYGNNTKEQFNGFENKFGTGIAII